MTIVGWGYGLSPGAGGTAILVGDTVVAKSIDVVLADTLVAVTVAEPVTATANGPISATLESLEFNADLNPDIDVIKNQ